MSTAVPDLTDTDRAILSELADGARTQGYLIDNTTHSRGQIQRRLDALVMGEYIEKIHVGTALYESTDKGRDAIADDENEWGF